MQTWEAILATDAVRLTSIALENRLICSATTRGGIA